VGQWELHGLRKKVRKCFELSMCRPEEEGEGERTPRKRPSAVKEKMDAAEGGGFTGSGRGNVRGGRLRGTQGKRVRRGTTGRVRGNQIRHMV